jgi:hypothetical protein
MLEMDSRENLPDYMVKEMNKRLLSMGADRLNGEKSRKQLSAISKLISACHDLQEQRKHLIPEDLLNNSPNFQPQEETTFLCTKEMHF